MIGVLSIAVGIASVIAVLSLAEGAYQGSRQAIGQMGADKISISELRGEDGGSRLTNEDAEAIGKTVANVRDTVASLYRKATVQYGDQVVEASLYARSTASPPQFMYEEYSLESGAFLSERDDDDRTPVAVVGAGLRQQLFPTESNPVGRTLVIDGLPYEVKGVLAPHPIAEGPLYTRETATQLQTFLHVPYQTAITGLFPPGASPSIDVFVADPARAEETAADIRDLLIRRHGGNGFGLMVHQRLLGAYADLIEQNYLVLGGVGVIALVVGGAGIAATMLASVAQRRREIAIRMVVGARRKDIAGQFLAEAIGTAVAGALIGILAGFAVVPGVSAALGSPTATAPWFLPATVGLALVAGLASGILPALKAAQLEPRLALSAN
ncbi:MAG: ABC transporter permease [Gammaproteobacteria bacterium]|nr:ABC transporter permease [Gammaproteobacteria bacterium]